MGRIQPKNRFEPKAFHSNPVGVQGRGDSSRTHFFLSQNILLESSRAVVYRTQKLFTQSQPWVQGIAQEHI